MDPDRFDALSRSLTAAGSRRRAVTLALGGSLGLLGLAHADEAAAKKKCPPCKKRKNGKCRGTRPDGTACPGGTCRSGVCQPAGNPPRGDPCPGQTLCAGVCIPTDQCCTQADCPAGSLCCNGACSATLLATGENCFQDSDLCCSNYCHIDKEANTQFVFTCAAMCRSRACADDSECCRGEPCLRLSTGLTRCGGCGHSVDSCTSDAECCFSACTASPNPIFTGKQCLSYPGGPCQSNIDCRSCYEDGQCSIGLQNICHAGICGCPYACCSNSDCPFGKFCKTEADGLNGTCQDIVIGPP